MTMQTANTVVGWGYEGKSPSDLLEYVVRYGIKTVVDIRLNAVSRKPGFSKVRLREVLEAANIEYLHMPELGNPRDNRTGFSDREGEAGRAARVRFSDEVLSKPQARGAIETLIQLAAGGPLILLCFEDEELCCHRSLVLDAITNDAVDRVLA